jgi:hypothetical protein
LNCEPAKRGRAATNRQKPFNRRECKDRKETNPDRDAEKQGFNAKYAKGISLRAHKKICASGGNFHE